MKNQARINTNIHWKKQTYILVKARAKKENVSFNEFVNDTMEAKVKYEIRNDNMHQEKEIQRIVIDYTINKAMENLLDDWTEPEIALFIKKAEEENNTSYNVDSVINLADIVKPTFKDGENTYKAIYIMEILDYKHALESGDTLENETFEEYNKRSRANHYTDYKQWLNARLNKAKRDVKTEDPKEKEEIEKAIAHYEQQLDVIKPLANRYDYEEITQEEWDALIERVRDPNNKEKQEAHQKAVETNQKKVEQKKE